MHYVLWVLALVVLDVGFLYLWAAVSSEENCGNGITRWTCAEVLQDAIPVLPYAFSTAVAVTIFVMLLGAASALSTRQRPDNAASDLPPAQAAIEEWPDEHPSLWDKTTRRAYKKQHGHWPDHPRAE